MRKSKTVRPAVLGSRVGFKRSDMRWRAPDGEVWDSRFEYLVFTTLKDKGYDVRRTTEQDSLPYTSDIRAGRCLQCGSGRVISEHRYTPDLYINQAVKDFQDKRKGYYLEVKGYLRAERRSLLRSFRKTRPDIDLRLLIQRDYPVGKKTLKSWAESLCKMPTAIWTGDLPDTWK